MNILLFILCYYILILKVFIYYMWYANKTYNDLWCNNIWMKYWFLETLNVFETNVTPSYVIVILYRCYIINCTSRCEPFIALLSSHVRCVDSQSRNTGFQHSLLVTNTNAMFHLNIWSDDYYFSVMLNIKWTYGMRVCYLCYLSMSIRDWQRCIIMCRRTSRLEGSEHTVPKVLYQEKQTSMIRSNPYLSTEVYVQFYSHRGKAGTDRHQQAHTVHCVITLSLIADS